MNDKQSITNFWNKICDLVDYKTSNLKFDKTFQSTIWGKNTDGTYSVSYMGNKYNVPNALGTDLKLGQSVWVKIPNGIFRKMHICGIANNK